MNIEMKTMSTFTTSSCGLPVYRVQFLNQETGEVIGDVDVCTCADCVKYINENPMIKENLGFEKGNSIESTVQEILDNLLYPYYAPEFVSIENISALPEFDQYIDKDYKIVTEKGKSVKSFNLAVKIAAGSDYLVRCSLIRIQNNVRETIENKQIRVLPGKETTLDFKVPGFTNDIQYFFEISDNDSVVESVKIEYEFALPIYVGYVKDGLLDPRMNIEDINTYINGVITMPDRVEKRLVSINSQQEAYFNPVIDRDLLCPFIMVPLRWNSLIRIEDINGIDITKFFGHNNRIELYTDSGNTDYEGYVIYISRLPADSKAKTRYLRGIKYTFTDDIDWKDLASEGNETEILTGFDVLTCSPIDSRFVKESYDDLAYISKKYEGLVVYIKNIKTFYKWNGYAWEVTNNMTHLYSGKPSDTVGGKMDVSIDIATGNIYQKTNSNVWELKGNIRTGVTE